MSRKAVFLDRDGVVVEDTDASSADGELRFLAGAPRAIARLGASGLAVIVVSNQPIVARGLATEEEVERVNARLDARLRADGAVVERFYFCPHHPSATLERYRVACDCRKPRPGMLLQAARELKLNLAASVMVGDRLSDIAAGRRAGCGAAVQVLSGKHLDPPIESPDGAPRDEPDFVCAGLAEAVDWILRARP
jgi:D-glycero-D-manno-heptose 1,7-bisphosphate phosphatase